MRKLTYIIIIFFFTTCDSDPNYKEVVVNKSIKVFSKDYHDKAENYTFKWKPPMDPNNQPVLFDLKKDMLIFSPILEGDYKIHLSITDIAEDIVAEEMFYYRVIAETLEVSNSDTTIQAIQKNPSVIINPSKNIPIKNEKEKSKKYARIKNNDSNTSRIAQNVHFTIQVAAWPSLEQARIDQLKLVDEGIDAYVQRHYRKEKDAVWYRIRVGNFTNKDKAMAIQQHIESITGNKSWLDVIPIEKNR